jgi:hypothetical protein
VIADGHDRGQLVGAGRANMAKRNQLNARPTGEVIQVDAAEDLARNIRAAVPIVWTTAAPSPSWSTIDLSNVDQFVIFGHQRAELDRHRSDCCRSPTLEAARINRLQPASPPSQADRTPTGGFRRWSQHTRFLR